jgi:hypothetical protein
VPPIILNAEVIAVVGVVAVGDLDDTRRTDAPTARLTITPPKHAASGNALRVEAAILPAEMTILVDTAFVVEMTALEETMMEEGTRKRATIAGSQAIADPIVFTTNDQRNHEAEFAKAQLQSPPLEIEISFDNPVMHSPPPPIQLGSSTPGPLTICATIEAQSSHSRHYADLCSLNLAMITQ